MTVLNGIRVKNILKLFLIEWNIRIRTKCHLPGGGFSQIINGGD